MANSILSQDEVDALLNAAEEGDVPSEDPAEEEKEVRSYIFRRPELIGQEQFRDLTNIHEGMTRELQLNLALYLHTRMEVRLALSMDQPSYAEFIAMLPEMTHMVLFDAKPLPGTGILELNLPMIYGLVDMMLGGDGKSEVPDRELTEVECAIFDPVLQLIFDKLEQTLSTLTPITLERNRVETLAGYAQIAEGKDSVIVGCIELRIGEVSGQINVCYPPEMVAALVRELQTKVRNRNVIQQDPQRAQNRKLLLSCLQDVPVQMPVVLGEAQLSARDWLNVGEGDVLVLPQRVFDPVRVDAESEPMFYARPGRLRKQLAVRLLRAVADEQETDIATLLD